MNKENCALKLVDEIILYYDARSKKHQLLIVNCEYEILFITVTRKTEKTDIKKY